MKKSITCKGTTILIVAILVAIGLFAFGYWAGTNTAIECGSCGAHTHNYWYLDNIHSGEPVKVCEICYQSAIS